MPSIEVVPNSTSISAPGWAYVPDTGYDPSKAPIQTGARKRTARIAGGGGGGDTTVRQNIAILKRLADLDKDNTRDVHIAVPNRGKDAPGRGPKGKTPVTRKILIAQKTFANYIADEEALAALEPAAVAGPKLKASNSTLKRFTSLPSTGLTTSASPHPSNDASLPVGQSAPQNSGFTDLNVGDAMLLQSAVPTLPSDSLLEALVSGPPLSDTSVSFVATGVRSSVPNAVLESAGLFARKPMTKNDAKNILDEYEIDIAATILPALFGYRTNWSKFQNTLDLESGHSG